MLDLDALANRRAAALAQEQTAWRKAVWSSPFQSLSARLSDGEVADLLDLCTSAPELNQLTQLLDARPTTADATPLDWLKHEADGQGVSPADWVKRTLAPVVRP